MKNIGILGGMSAESTQLYYKELCRLTRERMGGLHSPNLVIRSLDFAEIEALQMRGDWAKAGEILNREAMALERAGADLLLLATNTMHKLADGIIKNVGIPFLHIADATAHAIKEADLKHPGLIATAFTMEETFYLDRLKDFGLLPVVPAANDRETLHRVIYDELCEGIVNANSKATFIEIAETLVATGADCIILGCTEVGMLLNAQNVTVPVFDTTLLHCAAAFDQAYGHAV